MLFKNQLLNLQNEQGSKTNQKEGVNKFPLLQVCGLDNISSSSSSSVMLLDVKADDAKGGRAKKKRKKKAGRGKREAYVTDKIHTGMQC